MRQQQYSDGPTEPYRLSFPHGRVVMRRPSDQTPSSASILPGKRSSPGNGRPFQRLGELPSTQHPRREPAKKQTPRCTMLGTPTIHRARQGGFCTPRASAGHCPSAREPPILTGLVDGRKKGKVGASGDWALRVLLMEEREGVELLVGVL
jgi:hypothetical protein